MKMKKIFALMLSGAMMLSMGTAVFATEGDGGDSGASTATSFSFTKKYVDSKGAEVSVYPAEELQFSVTADSGNPDGSMISVADYTVGGASGSVAITLPPYTKVGKYNYTITEEAGNTQGVTYSTAPIGVQVFVAYNDDHTGLVTETVFTTKTTDGTSKIDSIVNKYEVGALQVSKNVTGNLGDQGREFDVDVTFAVETGKTVRSDITYEEDGETKTIAASDLAKGVTIAVKHGETITFSNIPVGVTYTVKEKDYTGGEVNGENGYDDAKYAVNGGTLQVSANGVSGKTTVATDTVAITNNKGTSVDTGITLDSLPYIMVLCIIAIGVVALFVRKRFAANN